MTAMRAPSCNSEVEPKAQKLNVQDGVGNI